MKGSTCQRLTTLDADPCRNEGVVVGCKLQVSPSWLLLNIVARRIRAVSLDEISMANINSTIPQNTNSQATTSNLSLHEPQM